MERRLRAEQPGTVGALAAEAEVGQAQLVGAVGVAGTAVTRASCRVVERSGGRQLRLEVVVAQFGDGYEEAGVEFFEGRSEGFGVVRRVGLFEPEQLGQDGLGLPQVFVTGRVAGSRGVGGAAREGEEAEENECGKSGSGHV